MRLATLLSILVLLAGPPTAWAQDAEAAPPTDPAPTPALPARQPAPPDLESIALDLPLYRVPGAVYGVDSDDIDALHTPELSEALELRVPGVVRNPIQGNPFQDELFFRGFLASPLLGSSIGLSAYLDGARINEAFGDALNWDLIPESALEATEVVAGPDALFGRNSLGGSLFLRTKSGFSYQGTRLEAQTGTEDRYAISGEHGGNFEELGWYLNMDWLDEDGWRRRTESTMRRIFGKASFRQGDTEIDASYRYAHNEFTGNGLVPRSTLGLDYTEVYTFPDDTDNTLHHFAVNATHPLREGLTLRGLAYFRDYDRDTENGDAELECEDALGDPIDVAPSLCEASGGELEAEAESRTTTTESLTWGARAELGGETEWLSIPHRWTLGTSYESSWTEFEQSEAEGVFQPEGRAFGVEPTEPFELDTDVDTRQRAVGVFARDVADLTSTLSLTLGARFDYTRIRLRDQTGLPENDDLNASHDFDRFTGGVGLSYRPRPNLVLYTSYREGWRAPTPSELTCADPDDPCNLPNAFVADPPLDEVKTGSFEVGARGELRELPARWSLAFYRSTIRDDLLFVQAEVGGGGFFRNVDKTRRMGVEAQLVGARGPTRWLFNYAWTDATYESFATLASPVEPAGVNISPGDQIPGIPEHNLSGSLEVDVFPWWTLGVDTRYRSGQYIRGDDWNRDKKTASYATVDLRTNVTLPWGLTLWARAVNLFDKQYESGGARNFNAFAQPEVEEERFLAPGDPRRIWVGLRWELP